MDTPPRQSYIDNHNETSLNVDVADVNLRAV